VLRLVSVDLDQALAPAVDLAHDVPAGVVESSGPAIAIRSWGSTVITIWDRRGSYRTARSPAGLL
jgi:hypothetical protein